MLRSLRLAHAAIAVSLAFATPAAAANCTPEPGWATLDRAFAGEVLRLVNDHRTALRLPPLSADPALTAAAEWKSAHMAGHDYFGHDDPAPPVARTPFQRMYDCGYAQPGGENIAAGQQTPAGVMAAWLGSEGHRRNIENRAYTQIGIGVAANGTSVYGIYWTQDFGTGQASITPNRAPVAANDTATVVTGQSASIAVTVNDSDPDGDTFGVTAASSPQHGVTVIEGGAVRYTPGAGYVGSDSFTYTVTDARGGTAVASVAVTVVAGPVPGNRAPIAVDDAVTTAPATAVTVALLVNDSDPDADGLVLESIGAPVHGRVERGSAGLVTYTPAAGFAGTERIVYTIGDGRGGHASATLQVSVGDRPTAPLPGGAITTRRDHMRIRRARRHVLVWPLGNDSGKALRIAGATTRARRVTVRVTAHRRAVRVTLRPGAPSRIVITYRVRDDAGATARGTIVLRRR